jgi:hypothetical protein
MYLEMASGDNMQQLHRSSTDENQVTAKEQHTTTIIGRGLIMIEILNGLAQISKDIKELKELTQLIVKILGPQFNELWYDNQDIALALHLSKRTLQTLRTNGMLPYSRLNNKIYYKVTDVKALLESNYLKNYKSRTNAGKERYFKKNT